MPYPTVGVGGSITVGGATVANVDVWDLPQKGAIKETTAFGATGSWTTQTPTLKSWTAKVKGRTDPSDSTGQALLFAGLNTSFALVFKVDSSHNWAGNGYLTQIHPVTDVNNTANIEFDFTGNGVLTYT